MELHEKYDKLLLLATRLRSAEWDAKKYGGNTYKTKAKLAGLALDKFIREENAYIALLKKEITNAH